jgi:hypothetical protein
MVHAQLIGCQFLQHRMIRISTMPRAAYYDRVNGQTPFEQNPHGSDEIFVAFETSATKSSTGRIGIRHHADHHSSWWNELRRPHRRVRECAPPADIARIVCDLNRTWRRASLHQLRRRIATAGNPSVVIASRSNVELASHDSFQMQWPRYLKDDGWLPAPTERHPCRDGSRNEMGVNYVRRQFPDGVPDLLGPTPQDIQVTRLARARDGTDGQPRN